MPFCPANLALKDTGSGRTASSQYSRSGIASVPASRNAVAWFELTVGIDLAKPERTGIAWINWKPGRAVVTNLICGADDPVILAAISQADKAGIDCPLGWPTDFVTFVAAHQNGEVAAPFDDTGRDWRRRLTTRLTDRVLREQTGLVPLSAAADRIGHVALRRGLDRNPGSPGLGTDRGASGPMSCSLDGHRLLDNTGRYDG